MYAAGIHSHGIKSIIVSESEQKGSFDNTLNTVLFL